MTGCCLCDKKIGCCSWDRISVFITEWGIFLGLQFGFRSWFCCLYSYCSASWTCCCFRELTVFLEDNTRPPRFPSAFCGMLEFSEFVFLLTMFDTGIQYKLVTVVTLNVAEDAIQLWTTWVTAAYWTDDKWPTISDVLFLMMQHAERTARYHWK